MRVLFLCVANSARSQIAEGLAREKYAGFFDIVASAGSNPSGKVRPLAAVAMKEVGIDISSHASKALSTFDLNTFDFVVTLCAEEICPAAILKEREKHLHWPVEDPAVDIEGESEEQKLERFRVALKEIDKKLKDFVAEKAKKTD
mmetsp:Transcript_170/g.330  ORF Transcript_170/g.330 Transcript_170/m.330 type:complete len:145 (+) Transcript_170:97-531(+)|eukprot:CAMPEP_0197476756 /NCGR_PEP_ID=MMETSP1309-20131121/10141_1 /TAXON_ID=464262 /ORGANISM="Genus nov. species nov., Strain RCC998" /LENGTH=144 /DNA_ID=CAMNT_0043017261 /DNA_START=53 /DNA_END=487 /DNA_ORIENTATION=+